MRMSFMTNEIIKRKKKKKYIYIYMSYLINCEYFNNLNENGDMAGRILWRVYVHPHTQLKKSGISHTHTHTQSMRGFPIKTGTGSDNTHGDGCICHLYPQRCVR